MKFYLIFLTLFYVTANAQVNLDKSYNGRTGNTLFYDLNDSNIVWAIPKYLEATSANDILIVGLEYRVRYNVGLPAKTIADLVPEAGSPLSFRAFRATEVTLEQLTDIDPKFKPTIIPLGDIGMFGESIPYSLTLSAKHYPIGAKRTANHLFNGDHAYMLGRVLYHFSASRSGQLFQAQSAVAILTPKKKVAHTFTLMEDNLTLSDDTYTPQIKYNSQTSCWDKVEENVICLKD